MNKFIKINYSIIKYDFLEVIKNWFNDQGVLPKEGFSNLHNQKIYNLFKRENDQSTIWHKCFYEMILKDKSSSFFSIPDKSTSGTSICLSLFNSPFI